MPVVATSNATGETALVIVASKERLGTRAVMKASLASLGRQSTPENPGASSRAKPTRGHLPASSGGRRPSSPGPDESCRVVLGTWPRGDRPDFSKGVGGSKGFATNEHRAATEQENSAPLEIVMSEPKDEVWVAAVLVEAEHERQVIASYYLAAAVDEPESEAI